jgi:membrane associated rhomboid family serine protease
MGKDRGPARYDDDEENQGSLRQRTPSGKGYGYPIGPAQPPAAEMPATEKERRRFVFLIPLIVLANIAVLVVVMYYNDCPKEVPGRKCVLRFLGRFSFEPFKENPMLGPSAHTLQKLGGLNPQKVVHGQGWRLVSCIWLHAGVFHLIANMLGLLLIGIRLEYEFGFIRIGIVYLVAGFGGSLLSALFLPTDEISVGASGALFGLLGATVSELLTNWTIYANKCLALFTLIVVIAVNLAFGLMPYVDNFAHIGGFVSGFLLGFVFLVKPQYGWVNLNDLPPGYRDEDMPVKSKHTRGQWVMWFIALIILVCAYAAAAVTLFTGVDARKKCHWCHYLSCVPIKGAWSCDYNTV